ncbi:MAG: 3-oxoacyl-ACP synthase [Bacteroidetes bacterium]|nr:3-oxoacyl-ACP synthase [Bacteroidota bacterium]MDA1121132.1 3-oxoacyl-ACP synthase [Bacteroidota bacterium]
MATQLADIKIALHTQSCEDVSNKIDRLNHSIDETSKALVDETKSSAGDKYETGREMIKQEIDKLEAQLILARRELQTLTQINPARVCTSADLGALVTVDGPISYFISISGHKLDTNEGPVLSISPMSPIGQAMLGCKTGDEFVFGEKSILIQSII